MVRGGLTAVVKDRGILAVRSSAPVSDREAARIVEGLLCPRAARRWTRAAAEPCSSDGPARLLDLRLALAPEGEAVRAPSHPDVLWILCQLALSARDLGLVLEVELDGLRGSVSTGGLDAGAHAMLAAARLRAAAVGLAATIPAAAAPFAPAEAAAAHVTPAAAHFTPAVAPALTAQAAAGKRGAELPRAQRTARPRARRLLAHAG